MDNRLKILIKYLDVSKTEFANSLNKKLGTLGKYLNDTLPISKKLALQIKEKYPQVNYEWLRFGKGEMLINTDFQTVSEIPQSPIEYLQKENSLLKQEVELLREKLALYEDGSHHRRKSEGDSGGNVFIDNDNNNQHRKKVRNKI